MWHDLIKIEVVIQLWQLVNLIQAFLGVLSIYLLDRLVNRLLIFHVHLGVFKPPLNLQVLLLFDLVPLSCL